MSRMSKENEKKAECVLAEGSARDTKDVLAITHNKRGD